MSFIHNLDGKSDIFEPEVETSVRYGDVKKKFGIYRSNTEQIDAKYREAKRVIDRLKDEIQTSREMEKSQRMRISSLQSRITVFEGKWKKLYELSDQQRNNSVQIKKIDSNIINITNSVQGLKEKFQTVITRTVKEIDVIKEKTELQSILEAKEVEMHRLRNEMNSVICEKEVLITKYETENEELRKETEILKSQANDTKAYFDNMVNTYEQQIFEYKRIIEKMEKERKSILGDYDIGSTLQETNSAAAGSRLNDKAVTWPDSTVTCLTEEREKPQSMNMDLNARDQAQGQPHPESKSSSLSQKSQERRPAPQFSKFSYKQKPKLQFLDATSEISAAYPQPQPKKRLYSQNSNHYIN